MKEIHLINRDLYEAWRKAGLNDEDAKQAAIESAHNDLTIATLIQSMVRLERANTEGCRRTIHTILIAMGVATTYISLLIILT